METTKGRCLRMLVDKGLFPEQAEAVLEQAMPRLAVSGYRWRWDRPSDEYPAVVYDILRMVLFDEALKWIDVNLPQALFRPMFERKEEP